MIGIVGIYKITNRVNGKCYIGKSVDINKRWIRHRCCAGSYASTTPDNHLYRAMKKYGIENFEFEVIEECDIKSLCERERCYIELYRSYDREFGYNMTLGGEGTLKQNRELICELWNSGLTISEIARHISGSRNTVKDALKESRIDYKSVAMTRGIMRRSRPVEQHGIDGSLLKIWRSARQAERELHIDHSGISDCCNYIVKQAGGYVWRYAERSETAAMADLLD